MWTISLIAACIALFFLGLVVLVEIGSGGSDLTCRLDQSRADELGELARGFNRFIGSLRGLIGDVLNTRQQLRAAVGQVAEVIDSTATRAGRQHE